MKRAVSRSIQYFWSFPHSQLYVEPDRLAKNGLLEQKLEHSGRRRKVYSLTSAGESALAEWMKSVPGEIFELRDLAVMQLFFAESMSEEQFVNLAKKQIEIHRERLRSFEEITDHTQSFAGSPRMLPMKLGKMMSETFIRFWSQELENTDLLDKL